MTEEWRPIKGYEGVYEVSNLGRVRSLDRLDSLGRRTKGVVKKLRATKNDGYVRVELKLNGKKDGRLVHRIVAETFIPNPQHKPTVNHINHVRDDNRVENLEWATPTEQNDDIMVSKIRNTQQAKVPDIMINDVIYHSKREVQRELGINRGTLTRALEKGLKTVVHNKEVFYIGE